MTLISQMDNATSDKLITSIKKFSGNTTEAPIIKDILKTFLYNDMAIKNKPTATLDKQTSSLYSHRMKSIHEAKQAFLQSTVHPTETPKSKESVKQKEPTLHYAQLAITTNNEDPRSTGGGKDNRARTINTDNRREYSIPNIIAPNLSKKKLDQPSPRKVSFKVKNASMTYRRPPVATKSVTITSNKVSDLTKKFNELITESHRGSIKGSELVKTIENLQSNSSTPSSTLSSSPNIKIVLRQKRASKRRNNRKRCSSVDSIDKLVLSDTSSNKIRIIRSKSDGTKIPKSPKKRLKYPGLSTEKDEVDGKITIATSNKLVEEIKEKQSVKNVIKKFECEIIAHSQSTLPKQKPTVAEKPPVPLREKPKVPEKKSTLCVTKNVVVKNGIPKLKLIRPPKVEATKTDDKREIEIDTKKEPIYDKRRYKTSYINTTKLPLHLVEIIQEDVSENSLSIQNNNNANKEATSEVEENSISNDISSDNVDLSSKFTPNDSFLWRRKISSQISSEASFSDTSNGVCSAEAESNENIQDEILTVGNYSETNESQNTKEEPKREDTENNSDFESNLVEAFNKEVLIGYTPAPNKQQDDVEDDYEPLEPVDDYIDTPKPLPVQTIDRRSKINCPLPEIPKEDKTETKENIYQCLLEMRSHPEGDESSIHSYESCENQMEERTRGDGDSDDGYEYCKAPIKPYCVSTSSGIHIAEDQQFISNNKNYCISKSVSGTSTTSYEKIDTERIYEKIPSRRVSHRDTANRNSFMSDTTFNDDENIYDTIKHGDGVSLSHCYESIPNSPSLVKLRPSFRKQLASAMQKRLSFDNMSNISQSTLSSEQKTNSIYGQRSVISYNGQEITFQVPSSDNSVSDRSDDWVDVSDEEKSEQQKIVIVRERSRGKKSPISWSQKVRHQWQKIPKQRNNNKDGDSSDSGHVYESLEPPPPPEDDFDSFDSDSDTETHFEQKETPLQQTVPISDRLPEPPSGGSGQYTLTKIASAAQRKMRQLKRNLTKRYTVAVDGKGLQKSSPNGFDTIKPKTKSPIYENCDKPEIEHIYSNISFEPKPVVNKTEIPMAHVNGSFKEELKLALGEKRIYGDISPSLSEKEKEKPTTPTSESKKDVGSMSRKNYFSFKSRFRRATSMAVDINEVPSALKITNSTFYLTDSMDGDSGFSNCSDAPADPPVSPARLRERRPVWAESTPCLTRVERPTAPPPPPPLVPPGQQHAQDELKRLLPSLPRKEKAARTRTSWYAECGAGAPVEETAPSPRQSSTSWYAEAGLYQAGNISSSSGASSESHIASPLPHSLFTDEPLYQFYNAAKAESVCRDTTDSDSDAYEAAPYSAPLPAPPAAPALAPAPPPPPPPRPSAMALVAPRGPARTLWCEVPEVVNSGVLSSLTPAQRRLQEAKFELLTSEASYLNSLDVLEAHFASHPAFRDPHVLAADEWEALFGNILPVRAASATVVGALERCWQASVLLRGACGAVRRLAAQHAHVYLKYCAHQADMVRHLHALRNRPVFAAALKRLESHPACQSLSLHSFLMLPMQRVTRLPLLLDAVLRNLKENDPEREEAQEALTMLTQLVSQCNEAARNTDRLEEMYRISRLIEFPPDATDVPELAPACSRRDRKPVRWLVRSGEMTQLVWKADESKLTFGRKFQKVPLHVYLFNDLFLIAKKKNDTTQIAIEWCARSLVEVCEGGAGVAGGAGAGAGAGGARHTALLTLLENRQRRTVEMLMSLPSETDLSRWTSVLSYPRDSTTEGEAVYAGWDCPQVSALYAYTALQPDELPLQLGDIVNVTRKTSEGWYYGERIRDGESGWFPGSYTQEIASPHVRARNLRQRYRLLALSGTYLGQKKRNT